MDNQESIGLFFDGKSSKPNEVHVFFDASGLGLQFDYEGKHYVWNYQDLLVEPIGLSETSVRHKNYRSQQLYFSHERVLPFLLQQRKEAGLSSFYERLLFSSQSVKIVLAVSLIAIGIIAYIFWVPILAAHSVSLIPTTIDKKVGDSYYNGLVLSTMKIDTPASTMISKMASELPYEGSIPVQVEVVKNDVVNAFALPNGHIIVFSGLIDKMNTAPELMSVLGHEMTHVSKRHSMRMLTQNLANVMLISILFSDVNGVVQVLIDNSDQLRSLSYSREYETEADKGSFILMKKARIDPKGLITLFSTLEQEHQSSKGMPEFLQSHPLTKNRAANARKWVAKDHYTFESHPELDSLFKDLKAISAKN